MKHIIEIVEKVTSKRTDGSEYEFTLALLNDDEVYRGAGHDYKIGDEVEAWYSDDWDMPNMKLHKEKN